MTEHSPSRLFMRVMRIPILVMLYIGLPIATFFALKFIGARQPLPHDMWGYFPVLAATGEDSEGKLMQVQLRRLRLCNVGHAERIRRWSKDPLFAEHPNYSLWFPVQESKVQVEINNHPATVELSVREHSSGVREFRYSGFWHDYFYDYRYEIRAGRVFPTYDLVWGRGIGFSLMFLIPLNFGLIALVKLIWLRVRRSKIEGGADHPGRGVR